ncbi:MAG: Ig-like domain-containing protein, partial [Candidatus Thermoplasmatota archaeon]|nr:Ig-like domain-containing protein [Candidatus Thermoplasmatota archaeon]
MKAAALFLSLLIALSLLASIPPAAPAADGVAVLCEVGTATWCTACPKTGAALHQIQQSDSAFYYVTLVTDRSSQAADRIDDYSIVGYPTSFFDGGYRVVFGGKSQLSPYQDAIQAARSRTRPDVDLEVEVDWLGDSHLQVTASVTSGDPYQGRLRLYLVEPVSRWNDYDGDPYRYAFLDFALDVQVSVDGTLVEEAAWNGSAAGYDDITRDNVMVIAALFNAQGHTGYSDPPTNAHPFDAHYADAVAAARPPEDSPPTVTLTDKPDGLMGTRDAYFSWRGRDDVTPESRLQYSYRLLGHEEQWSSWGQSTEAQYRNLPDGTYTFRVTVRDDLQQEGTASWSFTVDTSPPRVVGTRPANNAREVDGHTPAEITFSFPMNQSSVADALSISPPAEVSLNWREGNVLLITPVEGWEPETTYTIFLGTAARRTSGQFLPQPYGFSFSTAPADTTPPHVVTTHPAPGGTVASNGTLRIVFSEPMTTAFFTRAIRLSPWFPFTLAWEENHTTLLIIPRFLSPGSYTVTITTFAADRAGNRLPANYSFSFHVERPRVVATLPADGERGVPVAATISITFSQEMNHSSVREALNVSSPLVFLPEWEGPTLHLSPLQPLHHDTLYSITVNRSAA